jgi:ankyrin repeat protein
MFFGCSESTEGKNDNKIIYVEGNSIMLRGDMVISFNGIDIEKYKLDTAYEDIEELTTENVLCMVVCDKPILIELLEKGADVNSKCSGNDDLIISVAYCQNSDLELTRLFLNKGANINGTDEDNMSFLSYSISKDRLSLADFLIKKGADENQKDKEANRGCFPIHNVKSIDMLELLISNNFETNLICDNGRNLLHFAIEDNNLELVKYLVDNDLVNLNQRDNDLDTPLFLAERTNRFEIIEILNNKK